jgi:Protein of unknown function (DUF3800)
LGFSPSSTRYFVIAYLIVEHPNRIGTEVKRLLKTLNKKNRKKISEFKFSEDEDKVRLKVLSFISRRLNLKAGKIVVNKVFVMNHLRESKDRLYNYLIAEFIVQDIVHFYDTSHINLHLDLSMSRIAIHSFNDYFARKVSWRLIDSGRIPNITNKIFHDYSQNEPCIQVADYIAGSLFRFYERQEPKYLEIIDNKIVYSHGWGFR